MTPRGYAGAREVGDALAHTVGTVATLIGPRRKEPVRTSDGAVVSPGLGMRDDATALVARARDLERGLFTILILGEFKNGKSTLLNGMLGSKTLPAKAAPATAVITVLIHGERADVAVFESGNPEPRYIGWEAFIQEFQLSLRDQETIEEHGSIDRFAAVEYVQIERPHALCALGVKLIDSPGLGEHLSRTRVATNFLKRSQAVILVLNATRILTRDERAFIDTVLGSGRLSHVFFVVNRINQVDPAHVPEIRQWVQEQLRPHFETEDGSFDADLYARRVFFVDAKGALEARATVPSDDDRLDSSGILPLERELERFLTGPDKVASLTQSTVQFVGPVIGQALLRIEQTRGALRAPLATLEERRREAEVRLQKLEGRKRETERRIVLFGDAIKRKVFADLRAYVDEMEASWNEDSRRLMDFDRAVSLRSIVAAYAQREARDRMVQSIGEEMQRYVRVKFTAWSDRIPSVIDQDVQALVKEAEAQIEDLRLELDRIAAAFAGTPRSAAERPENSRLFQLALSLGDIQGITEDVLGLGDVGGLVGRMVQQSIVVYLVRTFVTGSMVMATVLVEVMQAGVSDSDVKRRLRRALGERLHEALRAQVDGKQEFVYRAVEERFQEFADNTTTVLDARIDEVRTEQELVLAQRRDEGFSVERETQRLLAIETELRRISEELAAQAPTL